jgi:hypothetical protein
LLVTGKKKDSPAKIHVSQTQLRIYAGIEKVSIRPIIRNAMWWLRHGEQDFVKSGMRLMLEDVLTADVSVGFW